MAFRHCTRPDSGPQDHDRCRVPRGDAAAALGRTQPPRGHASPHSTVPRAEQGAQDGVYGVATRRDGRTSIVDRGRSAGLRSPGA